MIWLVIALMVALIWERCETRHWCKSARYWRESANAWRDLAKSANKGWERAIDQAFTANAIARRVITRAQGKKIEMN